jgi:ATP-dependent helicase/nuclease subunit A
MTIHGSKGLEAPVVFIADAAVTPQDRSAWTALVDWPPAQDRPSHFLLTGKSGLRDNASEQLIAAQAEEARREDANLLYVAMTRARQYLFISGTESTRNSDTGWYSLVHAAAVDWPTGARGNPCIESGTPPESSPWTETAPPEIGIDPRLSGRIAVPDLCHQIAPSHTAQAGTWEDGDADGRERGKAIHLMLEHLTRHPGMDNVALFHSVSGALQHDPGTPELKDWWQEALQTYRLPAFAELFDPQRFEQAWSEIPVQYLDGDQLVHGIIDRLVLQPGRALVVDYKTHSHAAPGTIPSLVEQYRGQMRLYAEAASRLWPKRSIETRLLFTACGILACVD